MKTKEQVEKEFDEKFSAEKIWVTPSKDNIQTIGDIKSFIHQLRQDDIDSFIKYIIIIIISGEKFKCGACEQIKKGISNNLNHTLECSFKSDLLTHLKSIN
jgi:hypothetical protein